jgi:acetyl esterase/lipase
MPEPRNLGLKDSRGKPLRHKYLCQEKDPQGLFFLLPGDNYGVDGPLLYFPSRMLFSDGWDTIAVTYGYQSAGEIFSPAHIPNIVDECAAALQRVLEERGYPRIVLAGKSLGAAVIAVLCTMDKKLVNLRAVYLTPPLGTPVFDPVFLETRGEAYIAVGTADRFYEESAFNELHTRRSFSYTLIPQGDHSMNIPGDLSGTLDAHARVTKDLIKFAEG